MITIQMTSCISRQKIAYLNNLPKNGDVQTFTMNIPDYKIQHRDILYITIKAMTPDGSINDFLSSMRGIGTSAYASGEAGQYLIGYDVNQEGEILVPVLGAIKVGNNTLDEARKIIQEVTDSFFNNATVECKLLINYFGTE